MLLEKNIKAGFDYNPKCKKLNITHLTFVDDLFLLTGATERSFKILKRTIDQFSLLSGLYPNNQKSDIFLARSSDGRGAKLSELLGMPIGRLPMRYLGVPLISTRLKFNDCIPIL